MVLLWVHSEQKVLIIFWEKFNSIKIEDIFSGICPKERYKENIDCIVCDTKFNMFTIRKHW